MIVEICANSRQSAANALAGGAQRIELCRRLDVGGLTPSADDIDYCLHTLHLRTHVLVRPREGDFCYSPAEFQQLCRDVEHCRSLGAHAVVVGFLTPDGLVDTLRTRQVVQLAAPMQVTFHRAFDEVMCDPLLALNEVIASGCHRILTSGCSPSAEQGIPTLRALQAAARGRIAILAGAGVTPANAARIVRETGVAEIHGSCKSTLPDGSVQTDTETVKQLIKSVSL
ncbi:MAG: copper homeostasis protein CutC [Bacteroidales bacterium]|nr:copper homeostasis protein CutC [Bacteroidales bacterium]